MRRQRLRWFDTLEQEDLMFLAAYHHICLHTKLALAAFKDPALPSWRKGRRC